MKKAFYRFASYQIISCLVRLREVHSRSAKNTIKEAEALIIVKLSAVNFFYSTGETKAKSISLGLAKCRDEKCTNLNFLLR